MKGLFAPLADFAIWSCVAGLIGQRVWANIRRVSLAGCDRVAGGDIEADDGMPKRLGASASPHWFGREPRSKFVHASHRTSQVAA